MGNKHTIVLSISGLCSIAVSAIAQPDLMINRPRLVASVEVQRVTFSGSDCAVVEGCTLEGSRKLLKFDVGFQNAGNMDLVIGDPNARPDLFESSPCHGHFHMRGVADYELLTTGGSSVVRARKQGWCFRDNVPFRQGAGAATYNCEHQGISAGWEDVYDKSLDCQWLDVSGVPGGQYLLRVTVNPDRVFQESNYGNNTVTVGITLPGAPQVAPAPTPQPRPAQTQPPPNRPRPNVVNANLAKQKKQENAWKKLLKKFQKKKKRNLQGHGHGHG